MTANEFLQATCAFSDAYWCDYLEVAPATLRRWKTGKARIPGAVCRLLELRANNFMALAGARLYPEWAEFSFGKDGLFYHPFWKYGFSPWDLKALYFKAQESDTRKRDENRLLEENAAMRAQVETLKMQRPRIRVEIDNLPVFDSYAKTAD